MRIRLALLALVTLLSTLVLVTIPSAAQAEDCSQGNLDIRDGRASCTVSNVTGTVSFSVDDVSITDAYQEFTLNEYPSFLADYPNADKSAKDFQAALVVTNPLLFLGEQAFAYTGTRFNLCAWGIGFVREGVYYNAYYQISMDAVSVCETSLFTDVIEFGTWEGSYLIVGEDEDGNIVMSLTYEEGLLEKVTMDYHGASLVIDFGD